MKENTDNGIEKSWFRNFNGLGLGYQLKGREAIFTLLNTAVDLATVVPLTLTMIKDNDIDKEEAVATMLSSIRRAAQGLRAKVKECTIEMANTVLDVGNQSHVVNMFGPSKEETIKERFGYHVNPDLKQRVEDLLMACIPQSYKKNHIPDDSTLDFRVSHI
jgi:hypothetical protein